MSKHVIINLTEDESKHLWEQLSFEWEVLKDLQSDRLVQEEVDSINYVTNLFEKVCKSITEQVGIIHPDHPIHKAGSNV